MLLFTGFRDVDVELEVVSTVEEDEMSDLASLEILQQKDIIKFYINTYASSRKF